MVETGPEVFLIFQRVRIKIVPALEGRQIFFIFLGEDRTRGPWGGGSQPWLAQPAAFLAAGGWTP